MKKIISVISIILIIIIPLQSFAINVPGYEGGIQNENTYKEVIFVTGEPIVMEGTLTVKTKEKDNTISEQYTYKLKNIAQKAELSRKVKMTETLNTNGNQTSSSRTLDSYDEKLEISGKRYEVEDEDYQWNQGSISTDTPLNSYYAGDWSGRKTYVVDKSNEVVNVETTGSLVGYDSPWSATETQTVHMTVNYENKEAAGIKWGGSATIETSYNRTKDYAYGENPVKQISFSGGYRITEKEENVLKYSYDLPNIKNNAVSKGRNTGTNSFSLDTNPIITRLNIPEVRDVEGHPYEDAILLLASMGAFPLNSTSLGPDSPMSRGEFAKAICLSMGVEPEREEETTSSRRKKNQVVKVPTYTDVGKTHTYYPYIEGVTKRGIMEGVGKGRFDPNRALTKAEATTIIIRLLGFKSLAPIGNYYTGYTDDKNIPLWAKDSIYVAKELGIIERGGYFYPNKEITKGEAAELLVNFINYLQNNLKYDYRENILNN
jgi:hypothetical protein